MGLRTAMAAATLLLTTTAAFAQQGAVVPLPDRLSQAAQKFLPGVVGDPVPAFPISADLAALTPGSRSYEIVSGDDKGKIEQHVVTKVPRDASGTAWRYTVGDRTVFLKEVPGQSLSIVTEQDTDQGVMTRYDPAEPMLVAGMNAGDKKKLTLKVSVYDLDDPSDLEHNGSLDLTLTYVGAYRVTVPAGTYDAALLVWDFHGKVGPASVDDIQARFVAPGVGVVAVADKLDVAALLVYNDHTKVGKVLLAQ